MFNSECDVMKKYKTLTISILFIFIIAILQGCSTTTDSISSTARTIVKEQLIVGMSLSFPPFETTDEKGTPSGLSVDLAKDLGDYLNLEVKIENLPYDSLISAVKDKKVDVVISSLPITSEREAIVDFSNPYANIKFSLLLSQTSDIENLKDIALKGRPLAVKDGSLGHIYAKEKLSGTKLAVFSSDKEAVEAVISGKVGGYLQDEISIYKNWNLYPLATKINFNVGDFAQSWGIAISKDNSQLKDEINLFLEEYNKKGGFSSLTEKYLSKAQDNYKEWGIPFIFD